jgi:hypothetical protein
MTFMEWSKAWIVCDGPDCDNEHIERIALESGWTKTGIGEHLCPNHSADLEAPDLIDVKARAAGER